MHGVRDDATDYCDTQQTKSYFFIFHYTYSSECIMSMLLFRFLLVFFPSS